MIAIIDYNAGNLRSVENALRYLGADYRITSKPEILSKSDKAIFPGVGEAGQAMSYLKESGLNEALKSFAAQGKALLGICLGCQILLDHSEESDTELLGLIPGNVRRYPPIEGIKIPQIGWNTVRHDGSVIFKSIPSNSSFYFVNSYYLSTRLSDESISPWVCGISDHGLEFAAAVHRNNVWGTQFHPEKSGSIGLNLLKNFISEL